MNCEKHKQKIQTSSGAYNQTKQPLVIILAVIAKLYFKSLPIPE